MTSRQLDTSTEVSGPHAFAIRRPVPSSEAPPASIASSPASVTIAIRPFVGWTAVDVQVIWVWCKEKIRKFGNRGRALGRRAGLVGFLRGTAPRALKKIVRRAL